MDDGRLEVERIALSQAGQAGFIEESGVCQCKIDAFQPYFNPR